MKIIHSIVFLLTFNIAQASTPNNCNQPQGVYTKLEMVLNQFVFNNGNVNWGDWCYEDKTSEESKMCNTELDQWDAWLECSTAYYTESCETWADKENFASTKDEYESFISKCVKDNYNTLIASSNLKIRKEVGSCSIESDFKELTIGLNKTVICREVSRAITGSGMSAKGSHLKIQIKSRKMYQLNLSSIKLSLGSDTLFSGSGTLFWNPNGELVILNK